MRLINTGEELIKAQMIEFYEFDIYCFTNRVKKCSVKDCIDCKTSQRIIDVLEDAIKQVKGETT